MANRAHFQRNSWATDYNWYVSDPLPNTRRGDADSFSQNTSSTRRRLENDRNYRVSQRRERYAREQERVARRAAADRRAGRQRAVAIGNAVPGILSGVLGIMLSLLIIVHIMPVLFGINDMQDFFAGNEASVDRVIMPNGQPFYMFGATEKQGTMTIQGPDGFVRTVSFNAYGGDHFSMQETYNWVDGLIIDYENYKSNPFAGSALFFWDFITDNFQRFVTGQFKDVGEDFLDRITGAIGGFVDGIKQWWDKIFGTVEGG